MAIMFYYAPMSSATRVHWALEELGVPYEKVKVDTRAGDQKKPEYLAINPNGKVPALVVDGVKMFESLAMIIYLGERYGVAKGLWPAADTAARAEALAWATWGTVTLATNGFRYLANTAERFPAEARNAAQAEGALRELQANLKVLEDRLAGRAYILGDEFTLVDLANAAMVTFAMRSGLDMSGYPNVQAWTGRCIQRPAMAVAAAG